MQKMNNDVLEKNKEDDVIHCCNDTTMNRHTIKILSTFTIKLSPIKRWLYNKESVTGHTYQSV